MAPGFHGGNRSGSRRRGFLGRNPDQHACRQWRESQELALAGKFTAARKRLRELQGKPGSDRERAFLLNNLGVLSALEGRADVASTQLQRARQSDSACLAAKENLALLEAVSGSAADTASTCDHQVGGSSRIRVAIVSFLFNWPSTGGGIIHTVELGQFLARAGYDVRHIAARYAPWGIGRLDEPLTVRAEMLEFDESDWHIAGIQRRFLAAMRSFQPDYVIITDSWNFKPHLAEVAARAGFPYFLRQQALECLCPLNNLRLLVESDGQARQCPFHQLQAPDACSKCLAGRGSQSGGLHQAERALAGVGTPQYQAALVSALRGAEAVLVLNPTIQEMLRPYANDVRVVTWGMDADRFPWPWPTEQRPNSDRKFLFMAGVVDEFIKGFHVLQAACQQLWKRRQDFEVVATASPAGRVNDFTTFVGWVSQRDLPRYLRAADILVMPTIAQEGLGRSTVEAMAVGKPVIASNIGGLPYTVQDGVTGLLCEPGSADDLAAKIERLLDDAPLRERMGLAGRQRFESDFRWPEVIERQYRPLLVRRAAR